MEIDTHKKYRVDKKYHLMVDKWCLIEGPDHVDHDFTFLESTVSIPIQTGEMRLSIWMAYLATCHEEIKISPLEA
jgi:hypothetical protein